jgi:hypothetical protein
MALLHQLVLSARDLSIGRMTTAPRQRRFKTPLGRLFSIAMVRLDNPAPADQSDVTQAPMIDSCSADCARSGMNIV